ncbi:MAG: hypothetical protein WC081_05965 [Candidatus Ratteibacteria bacterium]|jgi:protein-export membrane protein SecD
MKIKCLWFVSVILLMSGLAFAEGKLNPENSFQIHAVFEVEKFKGEEKSFAELTDQAVSIIDARLKALGVKAESRKEGDRRIIVDLKEVQDSEGTLNIIRKPYYMEFKLVENNPTLLEKALSGNISENYQLLYEWEKDPKGVLKPSTPYLVFTQPILTSGDIQDAQQNYGQGTLPVVGIKFNLAGTKKFAEVTETNFNKRLAIVLDGIVQAAPVIKDRIPSGRAQISGRFTDQEASDLALALRTGSLPARLKLVSKSMLKVR